MKAFIALVHREFLEHRGAFLLRPLILVALLFGPAIFAFTFGRLDAAFPAPCSRRRPCGSMKWGSWPSAVAWCLYLLGTLFFYCADGFSADRRNNAMLFWKSMPVSDFKMLMAKLTATLTIFPGLDLCDGAAQRRAVFRRRHGHLGDLGGINGVSLLGSVVTVYGHVAASMLVVLALGLLWYLPFMALVGALATVVGRWAIPLSLLLPSIVSTIEWVTLGGWHPFQTHTWDYISYRADFPLTQGYVEHWLTKDAPFDSPPSPPI